jgi:septin family protein
MRVYTSFSLQDIREFLFLRRISCSQQHRLRQIDVDSMLQLHEKVNLIPVIAKADTVTEEDMYYFKARVRSDQFTDFVRITNPAPGAQGHQPTQHPHLLPIRTRRR